LLLTGVGKSMLFHFVPLPDIFPDHISAGAFDRVLVMHGLIFGDSILKTSKDFTLTDF
jgi:hypothetical protein